MRGRTAVQRIIQNAGIEITLQNIVDAVEDELLLIDKDYRIRFANSTALGKLTRHDETPIGKLCYEILHHRDRPCSSPLWDCPLEKVIQHGMMDATIHPSDLDDNKYLKITAYPLTDSNGNVEAVVELRRDVSAERQLESQILRRHHQLLVLSRISSAITSEFNLDEILQNALDNSMEMVNGTMGGILLFREDSKTLSYRVQHGLSAKYVEEMKMRIGEGIAGKVAQTGKPILVKDISKDPHTFRPDLINAEGIKGFISIPIKSRDKVIGVMNISSQSEDCFGKDEVSLLNSIGDYLGAAIEQARLYKGLVKAGERYKALLQHALTAQEEERRRIARELHDETSQSFTSLTLSLQAIIQMIEMKDIQDADIMAKLKKTHATAVNAGNEIVKLMKELRPTLLDELGLPAAINKYAKDMLQPHGMNVVTEFINTDERLPSEIEVSLFRIAQGAIGNILEHSEAKNVVIRFMRKGNQLLLRIADDGKGFEVGRLTRVDASGRGAGVFTMKERVHLVGGSCRIESKPKRGTKVIIKVPVG